MRLHLDPLRAVVVTAVVFGAAGARAEEPSPLTPIAPPEPPTLSAPVAPIPETMPETPPQTMPTADSTTPSTAATTVTVTDTTPMPVVLEKPWRLRLGADVGGGVFFPGPAGAGALALRVGAQRERLSLLVEVGALGGVGRFARSDDDVHTATGGAYTMATFTPGLQVDLGAGPDPVGFVGAGLVLGAGRWTFSDDVVDGNDITQRASKSAAFMPGLDARAGLRFGAAHCFTLTAGVKVLGTAVTTETVRVPATSSPTSTTSTGIGFAVLPTISIGYDFR